MSNCPNPDPSRTDARQRRLSLLAKAGEAALAPLFTRFAQTNAIPDHTVLRAAEVGTAMVRGRAGGVGAPFNLGEMSVTRMSVRLSCGSVGHGYVQGCSKEAARMVALLDAVAESGASEAVERMVLAPLERDAEAMRTRRAARAAATKVEFFTMVRGEN